MIVSEIGVLSKLHGILGNVSNSHISMSCWISTGLLSANSTKMHHRAPQELIPVCGHQTLQLRPLGVRHSESIGLSWTQFTPINAFNLHLFIINFTIYYLFIIIIFCNFIDSIRQTNRHTPLDLVAHRYSMVQLSLNVFFFFFNFSFDIWD